MAENTLTNNIEKASNKQIKLGSFFNVVLIIVDVLSGVFFIPWFIKSLGSSNYAIYSLSISIVNLFIIDFGLGNAVNRYVSKYRSSNDEEGLQQFLSTVYKMYLIITAAIAVALIAFFFIIEFAYKGLTPEEVHNLKIAYLITGFFAVIIFPCQPFNGLLNAYEKFVFLKLGNVLHKIIYLIVSIIILRLGFGLYGVILWHSLSNFLLAISKLFYVHFGLKIKTSLKIKLNKSLLKNIFVFTLWLTIIALASRLAVSFSSSILGIVSNSQEIAFYSIATTIESYAYLIGSTVSGFFMAKISRINEDKDIENRYKKITSLFSLVAKINFVLISIIFVGFVICGNRFMQIWLSDEYDIKMYFSAILLIVPQLLYTPTQVIYSAMVVEKKLKPLAIITIICSILNLGLTFLFGYFFGAIGAALGYCVAQTIKQILFCVSYVKCIHFNYKYFFKTVYFRLIIISLLTVLIGLLADYLIPLKGMFNFTRIVIVVACTFMMLVMMFGFSKEERKKIGLI